VNKISIFKTLLSISYKAGVIPPQIPNSEYYYVSTELRMTRLPSVGKQLERKLIFLKSRYTEIAKCWFYPPVCKSQCDGRK